MSVIQVERIGERRRALRVEEEGRALVTERREISPVPGMDEFLAPLFGRMLNLSETGILLELEESVQPGRRLFLSTEFRGKKVELTGIVARVCRPRRSNRVHIAIKFDRLSDEARETILRIVAAGKLVPYLN